MTHYDRPPSERVIVPFELLHDPMERLLIVNFRNDPDYDGIELQVFDDEAKGSGSAVLMYRTDGKLDWYLTPGLTLRMFPSFFRTWPTTYRWQATLSLTPEPTIRSSWSRTEV